MAKKNKTEILRDQLAQFSENTGFELTLYGHDNGFTFETNGQSKNLSPFMQTIKQAQAWFESFRAGYHASTENKKQPEPQSEEEKAIFEYVSNLERPCPHCEDKESHDNRDYECLEEYDGETKQKVNCLSCGATWEEAYKLDRIFEITEPTYNGTKYIPEKMLFEQFVGMQCQTSDMIKGQVKLFEIFQNDKPALRQEWNCYKDQMQREDLISDKQRLTIGGIDSFLE